jgi:beta-glucosidase-like glycosyl hydrolase
MGGVLSAAPVGEASVEFIRAGGDLCLVCHREDYIAEAYESLVKAAENDSKFARRLEESSHRILAFKTKSRKILHQTKPPSAATVEKLSRGLWEFGEQVRLEAMNRAEPVQWEPVQKKTPRRSQPRGGTT